MTRGRDLALALPTSILAFFSFLFALYVAVSIFLMRVLESRQQKLNTKTSKHSLSQTIVFPKTNEYFWEKPQLIMHHIFYMSISDCLLAFWVFLNYFPIVFNHNIFPKDSVPCKITGFVAQFSAMSSIIWYFLVAWSLFTILFQLQKYKISTTIKYHKIFAAVVIFICCLIPLIGNGYGGLQNFKNRSKGHDVECWVSKKRYYLVFYIPLSIVVTFAVFLFIIILWKQGYCSCKISLDLGNINVDLNVDDTASLDKGDNNNNNNASVNDSQTNNKRRLSSFFSYGSRNSTSNIINYNKTLLRNETMILSEKSYKTGVGTSVPEETIRNRITLFTIVFIVIWLLPLIERMYVLIHNSNEAPLLMICLHHYGIAAIGLSNGIIWIKSKSFIHINESWAKLYVNKKEEEYRDFTREIQDI